jgi:hypothetical protein
MVSYSTPPGYQRQLPIRRPKLDAFVSTIDHWLDEDVKVPRKQRHTAKRVFDRLRDERGFTGGYTIIKDYMRERDQRRQEVFVPLAHPLRTLSPLVPAARARPMWHSASAWQPARRVCPLALRLPPPWSAR